GYSAGEALALQALSMGAYYAGDPVDAVALARQAQQIDQADLPGWIARRSNSRLVLALVGSGDVSAARQHCVDALAQARQDADLRRAPLRKARLALGPGPAQAAHERGAAMTMAAAEFVILLATAEPQAPAGYGRLSARERELVSLIAQGNTDAQIASQLYI